MRSRSLQSWCVVVGQYAELAALLKRNKRSGSCSRPATLKAATQAFFAEIHMEAKKAKPGPGHHALAALAQSGKLQRQYTLNIDGLSLAAGMSTWHLTDNPTGWAHCLLMRSQLHTPMQVLRQQFVAGTTVEMHGSIHQLVCPDCCQVSHRHQLHAIACS